MNLIAMIGTINEIKKEEKNAKLTLKVEKPFIDSLDENDFFDYIDVYVNNNIFSQELKDAKEGTLIGFKGRMKSENKLLRIIVERVQVF